MPKLKLQALLSISQLDLTKSLEQILEEILTIVGHEMGAHSGTIILVNEETGELEIVATFGLPDDYIERVYSKGVPITNSPAGVVLETGHYYLVPNIFEEHRDKPWYDLSHELGISAQMFMPMKWKDEVIGLLNIHMADPHEFTQDEIAFVSIAASQAATVIEHARLYAKVKEEKTKLESEVSEHKRVEELLWESKEILSNILSASPIGIGIVKDRKLSWTNERMLEMMGFKSDDDPYDYVGLSAEVIYASKEEYDRVGRIFYEELRGANLVEVDAKLKRRDGSIFDGHIKMCYLDPSNPVKGAIATISDISWRKQAEEVLQRSETKYRHLFENLNDAVFLADVETGRIIEANKQAEVLLGRTHDEIIGMHQSELHPPEKAQEYRNRFAMHVEKGHAEDYDGEIIRKDGTIVPVNINAAPLNISGRQLILEVFRDLTERKQKEEMYRTLFENTGTAMIIVEDDMTISRVNDEIGNVWGYSKEEIEGQVKWPELVVKDDLERMMGYHRLRRIDPEAAPKSYEFQYIHKQGDVRDASLCAAMIPGTKKSVISVKDITEEKRMEEELRRSETLYRTIFEITRAPTVILDEDGTFYRVNTAGEKISGFAKEELEGKKKWTEFIAKKEDLEMMEKIHQLRINDPDNAPMNYEFLFRDRYGNLRNIYVTTAVIPGTKRSAASFMDITERKRAEEALRENEEKYRYLVENVQDGIFILQGYPYPKLMFCNEAFAKMVGYTAEEMMELTIQRYVAPEDLARVADSYRRRLDGEDVPREYEYRVLHKDGKTRIYVNMHVELMEYQGKIATIGTVKDITEHKLAEKALQESEERFHSLFDNLSVGVAMIDGEGHVLAANKTVCRFLCYSQEELIGMPLSKLIYPEDLDADRDLFKPIIKGEEDHCLIDKRYVRKDGEIVWGRLHLSGVKDDYGHIKYLTAICEDITECKLVEKALLAKNSELASVFAKCKHMKSALKRSEQKYKEIAEFLPDLIYKSILLDA